MSACRVTLTPEDRGQGVSRVQVRIELDGFGQKAGHTVMKAQLRTVGVPGAEPEDVPVEAVFVNDELMAKVIGEAFAFYDRELEL